MDIEDYARTKFLNQLAVRKWSEKGWRLAGRIQEIMRPLEAEYHLDSIVAEVAKSRWTVQFTEIRRNAPVDVR
ncbi:MAG: hypothetical protein ACRD3D_08700 [Terriglobia bacterium]